MLSNDYGPPVLDFRILGPLEVGGDEGSIRLGGPKQRATLAILLLNANRVVSIDRLAEDLYAGAPPVTAVTQVQRQISELRKALVSASVIETRAPGYVIRLAADQLDLGRFERLSEEANRALARGDALHASDLLRQALGLWRGEPLVDLGSESFALVAIQRLQEIRLAALEQRIEAELALGRDRELIGELEELVAENPLREHFRAQLMVALYRSGRQAEALEAYRSARETLVEELGIEPTRRCACLSGRYYCGTIRRSISGGSAPPILGLAQAVLVVSQTDRLDGLLSIAEPLAELPERS